MDRVPSGFVRLAEIEATIREEIRYAGNDNFLGRPLSGYDAASCILTREAARGLAKAQAIARQQRLSLVVFDCYRPARAVDDMIAWTRTQSPPDQRWYPRVRRGDLVGEGYIGASSSHSRGSTVDVALVSARPLPAPRPQCGARAADMLDFGTGFDCFDPRSETGSPLVGPTAYGNRKRLVEIMRQAGFRNYAKEWWHFTLKAEPFGDERFDFPVTAPPSR